MACREDIYDVEYSKRAHKATCTVNTYKTINYDSDSYYAGWGVTVSFPESFSRCNSTCENRLPLWCFTGSNYLQRATSNRTKYTFDTTRMPNLIENCIQNCTLNKQLDFRIFAL